MGQIPVIGTWAEARPYLANLRATVEGDVRPLLATGGGAPFAVSREVLSYIDHLGHLYTGSPKSRDRSLKYLEEILAKVDPNYGRWAAAIYKMYRCGSVHEFEPKTLKNQKGQSLGWLCYQGARQAQTMIGSLQLLVTHLQPMASADPTVFFLPVSTVCLIDDLMASIDQLAQSGPEASRIVAWNHAARDLNTPGECDFTVP